MAKLTINGDYKIIKGTGDFERVISSVSQNVLKLSITYPEFSKCNLKPLHVAVISGDVDVGINYEIICKNNFQLITFVTTPDVTYTLNDGAFAGELIYQKYKKVTDNSFVKNDFKYCDIFICAQNVPIDVKFNNNIIRKINENGIYYILKQPLEDFNTIDVGNNKFLVVCYYDTINSEDSYENNTPKPAPADSTR